MFKMIPSFAAENIDKNEGLSGAIWPIYTWKYPFLPIFSAAKFAIMLNILGGVMMAGRCCDRGNFPKTRLSGRRVSWSKLAKARFWRLVDQWPFQLLVDKRSKAVIPAQDWPS